MGDSKNNRADLHLSVVSKTKEVKDLIRGDVIHIKRCFAMIDGKIVNLSVQKIYFLIKSDECIVLKADEDDVSISNKKMKIGTLLTTPIKPKNIEPKK